MLYDVWVWLYQGSDDPEIMVQQEADDPLEATFTVMRQRGVRSAYAASVFLDDQWVAGYSVFECPDREVC